MKTLIIEVPDDDTNFWKWERFELRMLFKNAKEAVEVNQLHEIESAGHGHFYTKASEKIKLYAVKEESR